MTLKSLKLWCNRIYGFNQIHSKVLVPFSVLGWKSKGLKSKGHFKSKGHSKSKGLKAWSWSRDFYWKGHGKGKSLKGKLRICNTVGIIEIIRQLEGE